MSRKEQFYLYENAALSCKSVPFPYWIMTPLIECIPNVSEGQNPAIIRALLQSIQEIKGVPVIDQHIDPDHNRTVFTFVGSPDLVGEAAYVLIRTAQSFLNIHSHSGVHPCVGVVDVVPFVPLKGASLADCVQVAKQVGARIGKDLNIPVFLYEEACSQVDRSRLETIRRGGLTGLRQRMKDQPSWTPDFGPNHLHPTAGVVVIGARKPLIAFNMVLNTDNLTVAQAIARKIRTSSGGFPALKAMGVELKSRGLVQVSMNLTDYHQTPLHVVFDAVKQEASSHGIEVLECEIVGLVPQEAVDQVEAHSVNIPGLGPDKILEIKMSDNEESYC